MKKLYAFKGLTPLLFVLLCTNVQAQWTCMVDPTGYNNNTTADVITEWTPRDINPTIGGTYGFTGLIEHLPDGYDPLTATTYPLIIYFGGLGAEGNGTSTDLCKIFSDAETSLPYRIETGNVSTTVTYEGNTYDYIVISPQIVDYQYVAPDYTNFIGGDEVEQLINYVLANYKVDQSRIYLTGMSSGANMVLNYAASSLERANRIAAFNTASLCSDLDLYPNTSTEHQNIIDADLPGRMFHCQNDAQCDYNITTQWANTVNTAQPGLIDVHILPPGTDCNIPLNVSGHNSWNYNYDPAYRTTEPSLLTYFTQFDNTFVLPVVIKSFTGKYDNGKVELQWITASEESSANFYIERAGADYAFSRIGNVPAAGNSSSDKAYSFVDNNPLPNLNLYRLVQVDIDGKQKVTEVVKVMNNTRGKFNLTVSPNPFSSRLTAFLNLDKKQQVIATITDLGGRKISTMKVMASEGSSQINLPTHNLKPGVYLLRIDTDTFTETQKIVKQ